MVSFRLITFQKFLAKHFLRSTITNTDALAINDAWAGLPGTLVKSYPSTDPSVPFVVDQGPCDGSAATLGWHLDSGKLYAPGEQNKTQPQCLGTQSGPIGQDAGGILSCPPPTTASPKTGCGVLFENCSDIKGSWTWNATTGLLFFTQDSNTVGMDEPTPSLNRMLSWSSRSLDPEHFNLTWQTNSVPSQTLRRTPPKPQCLQVLSMITNIYTQNHIIVTGKRHSSRRRFLWRSGLSVHWSRRLSE